MEGQTLGNTLCDLFICPSSEIHKCYDPKTIGYFAHLNPCFRFRPILMAFSNLNLKLITEDQQAINITCSHKDS